MSLPGLSPSVAAVALSRLMTQWMDAIRNLPERETSSQATDRLILACLLIAREDAELVRGTCLADVEACLDLARSGTWADLDEIPWLSVHGYLTTGKADIATTRRVERMLSHGSSSIRVWFHYVAWMIQDDLDVEGVRPRLLQNLADMLGGLYESAGLLAVLHDDKSVLDTKADAFEPPEGFEAQYNDRLIVIRDQQWNSFALNLWLSENRSRRVIWESVKSMEVAS